MLIKRAYAESSPEDPRFEVLRPGSQIKTARIESSVRDFIDTLKPEADHTYVLANAMGYSEFFGPNSNRDWYGYNENLNFNGLLHAWANIGENVESDRVKAKSWPYGYPSFYNANAFAHHKNDHPKHGFGDVRFVFANHAMKRIELVIRVNNAEAETRGHGSILDRVDNGERVDLSMGCKIPFDACSVCTDWVRVREAWAKFDPTRHRHPGIPVLEEHTKRPIRGIARTRNEYCQDMRLRAGQITEDGQRIFVFNDICAFFDISFVMIGADRTAKVMWFLSSPGRKPQGRSVTSPVLEALQSLIGQKTASMDKGIPGGTARAIGEAATRPSLEVVIVEARKSAPAKSILSTLARLGIMASPREFSAATTGTPTDFNPISCGADASFAVSAKDISPSLLAALGPLMDEHSSFARTLLPRLKSERSPGKTAQVEDAELAQQYAGYRLSMLREAPVILGDMGPDWAKISMPDPGLLLGAGGVVQWISSHLIPDLGSDAIETVNKLATMMTRHEDLPKLAMALDAAMRIEKTSLWGAIESVAHTVRDL